MAEQWLSIVEYARSYSVSDMTVRRRIKTGKLHAVLKEGKYYIPCAVENAGASRSSAREQAPAAPRSSAKDVSPRRADVVVVKSHPLAHNTYANVAMVTDAHAPAANRGQQSAPSSDFLIPMLPGDSPIPSSIRSEFEKQSTSMADARALLAFCDGSLRNANAAEKKLDDLYRSRIDALTQQVRAKDLELNGLRQQIEDMQLLVQILENKRM